MGAHRFLSLTQSLSLAILLSTGVMMNSSYAQTIGFDTAEVGSLPDDWLEGVTGRGTARWQVERDDSAPSKPNVLKQSGVATFTWCVRRNTSVEDGFVEVKFKPLAGKEDQAGGVVWRWKDADNYYVARANALENNLSLYYTEAGRRRTLKYVDAPVPANRWHTLRVEFSGQRIKVALNGKTYIELDDGHIKEPGRVGMWTKADSVTAFDDFSYGEK
ncbi:MAG TPA: family 16 glycoside hydrolase [Burkholderiales bacterium]|nr:family 16 glycoside hydrolase [Burkholderiales bacterium]